MPTKGDPRRKAFTLRMDEDTRERVGYWADKLNGGDRTAFIMDAIDMYIRFQNRDYPLSTMEQERLNQLIDCVEGLKTNVHSLTVSVGADMSTLIGLTRGDNDMLRDEDGDL